MIHDPRSTTGSPFYSPFFTAAFASGGLLNHFNDCHAVVFRLERQFQLGCARPKFWQGQCMQWHGWPRCRRCRRCSKSRRKRDWDWRISDVFVHFVHFFVGHVHFFNVFVAQDVHAHGSALRLRVESKCGNFLAFQMRNLVLRNWQNFRNYESLEMGRDFVGWINGLH